MVTFKSELCYDMFPSFSLVRRPHATRRTGVVGVVHVGTADSKGRSLVYRTGGTRNGRPAACRHSVPCVFTGLSTP